LKEEHSSFSRDWSRLRSDKRGYFLTKWFYLSFLFKERAFQKGLATGHIKGNENPSQLKNSLIVMQRDHMFVTDDQAAKQSLLRHIQRGHFDTPDEMYWSKSNGNQGSPNTRKLPLEESSSNTPETSRLIQRSMEDSTATYNSVRSYRMIRGNICACRKFRNGDAHPHD
ncbi:hypothetical protein OESDEN_23879, partial [Oesophagostomum dentatum]